MCNCGLTHSDDTGCVISSQQQYFPGYNAYYDRAGNVRDHAGRIVARPRDAILEGLVTAFSAIFEDPSKK